MPQPLAISPVTPYLIKGLSAAGLIELLEAHDCLTFPQLRSGLFPAANFDNLEQDETGMANAWLRDSAFIGLLLLKAGRTDAVPKAAQGILKSLHAIKATFDEIIASGEVPISDDKRPPVRFTGQDSKPQYEWANAQNDGLGYSLQFIAAAHKAGLLELNAEDTTLIDTIIHYFDIIKFWEDDDSGHWEEVKKVSASSIGTVIGGLQAIQEIASDTNKVTALIEKGTTALSGILPFESKTTRRERLYDSALVFLVEPQQTLSGEMAKEIIAQTEENLMGERGFRRYNGDSYWGPSYRQHFQLGSRTADFSRPQDMALRDSYLIRGGEAQWTILDPLLAVYYAKQYKESSNQEDAEKAAHYLRRSLNAIVTHRKGERIVWRIPELYFLEDEGWTPNDHLGLLWSQVNLLYALTVYQEVFGDKLLIL